MEVAKEIDNTVKDFVGDGTILVVDPSLSFCQAITSIFVEMGIPESRIHSTKKYTEAVNLINKNKPRLLITEYYVENQFGLSLIDKQSQMFKGTERVSILVTHNNATSSIAEAAEEHVDDYILKPFPMGDFKTRIIQAVKRKINPSPYNRKILDGKLCLEEHDFDGAAREFAGAMRLAEVPTLAHYYIGYTQFVKKDYAGAAAEFKKGLQLQPLHFKCLMGEFDTLFEQKDYNAAYDLVPVITKNFPLSPKRLGHVFISTVFSHHYEEIPKFFEIFKRLDNRPPELIKIFAAALMTAGKFHLKENQLDKAVVCFERGVSVIGAQSDYIETIVRELMRVHAVTQASQFLSKFPVFEIGSQKHALLAFLIDQRLLTNSQIIDRGRKLVTQGYADRDCFRVLVKLLVEEGKSTLAESFVIQGVKAFPDLRSELNQMLQTAS